MNTHHFPRRLMAVLLAVVMAVSMFTGSALAAQPAAYRDPAEHWMNAGSRTNILDANAVITHETFYCFNCGQHTSFTIWRCPEYTRDGQTALSRNIRYSDGTTIDGKSTGVILDLEPDKGGIWTHYHWTKSMCDTCGCLNSNGGLNHYDFGKNLYEVYDCSATFYEDLDEVVTYESADSSYHTKTVDGGYYCEFCFGTEHTHTSTLGKHNFKTTVVPELGNQRFAVTKTCADCGYTSTEYVAAKSVVADYYGAVDGRAHTLLVSDLSESGVSTKIRYGTSADSCTQLTPPSYTEKGSYTVYYKITYAYQGKEMTENGIAYVCLVDEASKDTGNTTVIYRGHSSTVSPASPEHNYTLLETVAPTCTELGYSRYLCTVCGEIDKRDFVNATGHDYQTVVIREADCDHEGKTMNICKNCGDVQVTVTPKAEHKYVTKTIDATCTAPGYTLKECSVCGDRQITNITPARNHSYQDVVIPATCETGGKTVHTCVTCGSSFTTDYTQPTGHQWDKGKTVTDSTCTGEGVIQYTCKACGETYIEASSATGHKPGPAATCTEPQICTECGAVLEQAHGHSYQPKAIAPTCTEIGYTDHICKDCGSSYQTDYTMPTGHTPGDWVIDKEPTTDSEGKKHIECQDCHAILDSQPIEKLYRTAVTDTHGEAVVEGYLVTVTDTDTGNPVTGATVALNQDKSISVKLPDGRLLDYGDQTTVKVTLRTNNMPVPDKTITVTDRGGNFAGGVTGKAGTVTVPANTNQSGDSGKSTVGRDDADDNDYTLTVRVVDAETGRPIEGTKVTIGKTGNITVVLPDGIDMDKNNRITVIVTDNKGDPQEVNVIVRNDLGSTATGKTNGAGTITVPASDTTERHSVYILGYPDGSFGPERTMTRCEAATIFARILSDKLGESVPTTAETIYKDIPANAWYSGYVKYLTDYGVVKGDNYGRFRPYDDITRNEYTAMAVRFFEICGDQSKTTEGQYSAFLDMSADSWAAVYVDMAAMRGWVNGYTDGTFRGGNSITRAEAVTITNRMLGRAADQAYIDQNIRKLNTFVDMPKTHWAYYQVMEAANAHTATWNPDESWSK